MNWDGLKYLDCAFSRGFFFCGRLPSSHRRRFVRSSGTKPISTLVAVGAHGTVLRSMDHSVAAMSVDTSVDDAMLAAESTGVSSDATATVIESTEICMADSAVDAGNETLTFGTEDPEAFNLPFDALSGSNQQEALYETTLAFTTDAEMSKMLEAASEKADDAVKSAIQHEEKTDSPSMQAAKKQGASTPATKPTNARKTGSAGTKRSKSGSQQQTFSWNDILRVQNLIESCLQKYLAKNDIITTLHNQAKVDPSFTAVVWQKLEEQNPKFFHAYKLQLQLRDQISTFNYLVAQHKDMMVKASGNPAVLSSLSMDARGSTRHSSTTAGSSVSTSASIAASRGATFSSPFGSASTSSLPMPSPIKTDLDTHAFFT